MKTIGVVACDAKTGAIGYNNELYHSLPGDLKYFRNLTRTVVNPDYMNVVVMGRKTWDSLPKKPLAGRVNIVFSKNPAQNIPEEEHLYFIQTIDQMLVIIKKMLIENIFIIGGWSIYKMFLDNGLIDEMFVTMLYPKKEDNEKKANVFFNLEYLEGFKLENKTFLNEDDQFTGMVEHYVHA